FTFTQNDLPWLHHRYLGEVLMTYPGVVMREQFSLGHYSQLTMRGVDWRGIAYTMNGRLLNDPSSGIYNPYYVVAEYGDRFEIVTGTRAFLYGLNSTGGIVNMVTRNYNSNRPLSKINYTEGGYNEQYSDGTFSQNISRRLNFTFGFQHQSTDTRFINGTHLAWNARVKLRYELSRKLNLILSEYYTSTKTQMNGGVQVADGVTEISFDPLRATVRNASSYEKANRHDVDLSLVGTLLGDTTNVTTLTLYYSNSLREYRDEPEGGFTPDSIAIRSDHRSSWMGALFTQNYDLEWQRLSVGGSIEIRQIEGSPNIGRRRNVIGGVWGKEELLLSDRVILSGYARYDQYLGQSYLGAGADATIRLSSSLSVHGGFSFSRRVPTYQELYWQGADVSRISSLDAEQHRNVEAGARLEIPSLLSTRLTVFHRTVTDPIRVLGYDGGGPFTGILFVNASPIRTTGLEASVVVRPWVLTIEGTGTFLIQEDDTSTLGVYPRFTGVGGVYYWNSIFRGALDLKVGVRGKISTRQDGEQFNPEVLAYATNTGQPISAGSSIDFVLTARIGDAHIHLLWENLLNSRYFLTPFYPVYERAVRFGISWQFLD
ncbi:MAG: TonB-dependent receptor plug domain-containing protein, partial [Ignavibacteria bacterium]|nr:TonB-dependent receptor plug domain-containing protein [Ignavibacteria bacterium]